MLTREKKTFRVLLADERTSEQIDYLFATYWSLEKDFVTQDSIAASAAAQAFVEAKGSRRFVPLSVVV